MKKLDAEPANINTAWHTAKQWQSMLILNNISICLFAKQGTCQVCLQLRIQTDARCIIIILHNVRRSSTYLSSHEREDHPPIWPTRGGCMPSYKPLPSDDRLLDVWQHCWCCAHVVQICHVSAALLLSAASICVQTPQLLIRK